MLIVLLIFKSNNCIINMILKILIPVITYTVCQNVSSEHRGESRDIFSSDVIDSQTECP